MEYRYTVNRVLRQTEDELRSVAHEEAEIEARELIMHSLGVESRAELAASVNKEINAEQYAKLQEYILPVPSSCYQHAFGYALAKIRSDIFHFSAK